MREVDGIIDFLDENGLLRVPPEEDPRTGELADEDEILEVDYLALLTPDLQRGPQFLVDSPGQAGLDADILGTLGIARDSGELSRRLGQAVRAPWDSCAWYAPMQTYGPAWGIYVRQECINRLSFEVGWFAWDSPRTPLTAHYLRLAAFFSLFLHEHFHHKLEGFGIRLALADRVNPDKWHQYDRAVYATTLGSDDNLEEALANADAYRRLTTKPYSAALPAKIRQATRRWMKWRFDHVDPPGYRMARHHLTDATFTACAERLQTQVLEAGLHPTSNPDHWQAGPNMLRSVFPITSDIYLVIPSGTTPSVPTTGRPYTVSVKKTESWLTKNGFARLPDRGKGDHEMWQHHDGRVVGLDSGAREVTRKLERTIAKSLGLSQRQFRVAVSEGRAHLVPGPGDGRPCRPPAESAQERTGRHSIVVP